MRGAFLAACVVVGAAAFVGCGGKVTFVDDGGEGGAGAQGSTSKSGSSGSKSSGGTMAVTVAVSNAVSTGSGSSCIPGSCTFSPDSCSCNGTCNGSDVHAICSFEPNGPADCTCFVGPTPVGSCKEQTMNVCDIQLGCCAPILLGDDL